MKATGIVRRIDDLGRIVIPKEMRRVMKIHEGDSLEIYTQSNSEIVIRKFSPIGEINELAVLYAEVLSKISGVPVIISDSEKVIASCGLTKRDILEKTVSDELDKYLQTRKIYFRGKEAPLYPIEGLDRQALIVAPVLARGDLAGSVIFIDDGVTEPDDSNLKLAKSAAMFLGKQIEG